MNTSSFDFKSEGGDYLENSNKGKILFNDSDLTYDDVYIRVKGGEAYVDQSNIDDLKLKNVKISKCSDIFGLKRLIIRKFV